MDTEQEAVENAEYAPVFWALNYFFCGALLLERIVRFWTPLRSHPIDVPGIVTGGLTLLYSLLPVLAGRTFRRKLKKELVNGTLGSRTFEMCDWRIAQLLTIVYMGMLLFTMR
jgi:hypothetical protein